MPASRAHPNARSRRRPGRARLTTVPLVPLPKLTLPSDELFAAHTVFKVLPYFSFHWLILGIWKCRQAGRVLTISYMERLRPLRSGTFGSEDFRVSFRSQGPLKPPCVSDDGERLRCDRESTVSGVCLSTYPPTPPPTHASIHQST